MEHYYPLIVLGVGIVTVLGLIIFLRANAFIALITAAMVVSLMAPGAIAGKISRVAVEFGNSAGGIGVVIAMAAIIGKCMLDSGAADRIVRAFLSALGEKRAPLALMGSGYVLAIPVFFDTVFYLLVPLARSLFRKTRSHYLLFILAISAGGAITHSLVPPTPGPLVMADNLGIDLGMMILVGAIIAFPAAVAGLIFAKIMDRIMPIEMRAVGSEPEPEPLEDSQLPSLVLSLAPVLLPVFMITANTVASTIADSIPAAELHVADIQDWGAFRQEINDQSAQGQQVRGATAEGADTPGGRILTVLREKDSNLAALLESQGTLTDAQREELTKGLNDYVLKNKSFYVEKAFLGIPLSGQTKGMLGPLAAGKLKVVEVERVNRLLLADSFGNDIVADFNWQTPQRQIADTTSLLGNANLALLISTVIAILVLKRQRGLSLNEIAHSVETALMSGGVIILITAAGGAFGAMLREAQVGDAIKFVFHLSDQAGGSEAQGAILLLTLGFGVSAIFKVAQGSSTVAMITVSAMLAGIADPSVLGCHPVYLATAIGGGSLVGSWMNDSGFWIFAKMGGLTEVEALKCWTPLLIVLGTVSYVMSLILATIMPLL